MLTSILFLLLGLAVLIMGGELLVRGAASIAKRFGISTLVIGLTVVAFGTSAPELFVNMYSAYRGEADLAIGNIIGSNIANILLILGISASIRPLKIQSNTTWKEIPFALLAIVMVFIMGNDIMFDGAPQNAITRTDGFSLIGMFAIFMFYTFGIGKNSSTGAEKIKQYPVLLSLAFTIGGILALFFGGKLVVENASALARILGMSETLIGLTIVAVGTSMPELVTSAVAAYHGHDDIAVGNIVGSNIFNIFWILGLTSVLLQLPFTGSINFDVLVAIGATLALFLSVFIGRRHEIKRWQGIILILSYVTYLTYIVNRG